MRMISKLILWIPVSLPKIYNSAIVLRNSQFCWCLSATHYTIDCEKKYGFREGIHYLTVHTNPFRLTDGLCCSSCQSYSLLAAQSQAILFILLSLYAVVGNYFFFVPSENGWKIDISVY